MPLFVAVLEVFVRAKIEAAPPNVYVLSTSCQLDRYWRANGRMESMVTNIGDAGAQQTDVGRAKRLKEATHAMHDRLDKSIMAHNPFESRARYALFVKVQHGFHREIDALYSSPVLDKLLPDLSGRRRFDLIEHDLADLGLVAPSSEAPPVFISSTDADLATALGWLYVAEGSNLGAAFLLKEAKKIGLSETFGARHLAAAPEGRGLHWKSFIEALDGVRLTAPEEERVITAGRAAFACVQELVDEIFPAHRQSSGHRTGHPDARE